jgi:hypothetical protein
MEYGDSRVEFIEANRARFEGIACRIDDLLSASDTTVVAQMSGATGEDPVLVQGGFTRDDFYDHYEYMGDDTADELAEYRADIANDSLILKISQDIEALHLGVSLQSDFDLLDDGSATAEELLEGSQLLGFDDAQVMVDTFETDQGETATLVSVALAGVEKYGSASTHTISIRDALVIRSLSITQIGDTISHVNYRASALEDPVLERGVKLMGVEATRLSLLLVGAFGDDDELDPTLNDIWLDFQGTSKEEEIGPFLDEVRGRAVAAKDSRELTPEGYSLPSAEQLQEFAVLLDVAR